MAFTGQLGTPESSLGYIVLGAVTFPTGTSGPALSTPLTAERLDGPTKAVPA